MYFITSESSFVRCGSRRPFFYGCVAGCLTWGSGTQAASCFTSCILVAVDPVSLHGMRNCPSITIVRARWYLDIIRSAEAPVNRVSINVWWWSTLINQRRLVGRLPGKWRVTREASSKASGFTSIPPTSVEKEGRKGTISTLSPFSDPASARRREKQVPGVQKKNSMDVTPALTPLNSLFMKSSGRISFVITTLGEARWGRGLWRTCQSAAVGSSQVCFHNNPLTQKADHIERSVTIKCSAEVGTELVNSFLHTLPKSCR